jgi:hypothetical protein
VIDVGVFVVIGGGEVGASSVRQLLRAAEAGRLRTERILVVDRDAGCAAAAFGPPVELERSEWSSWLNDHLATLDPAAHLVPYHWAPHLLRDWLTSQLTAAGADVTPAAGIEARRLPFESTTTSGDRALSYASWICPPTCIEPALCPHTRGARDWSLCADLERPAARESFDDQIVFRCLHLVYGVGTVPVRDILAARDRLRAGLGRGPRRYFIATSSHCHALAGAVEVRPRASR